MTSFGLNVWQAITAAGTFAIGLTLSVVAVADDSRTISVYGTELLLPIPAGQCALTKQHMADRSVISLTEQVNEGRNSVLMMFADCKELEDLRTKAKKLSNLGNYLAPRSARKRVIMPRADFAKIIGTQLEKRKTLIENAMEEGKRRVNAASAIEIQKNVHLGLIHRDDLAAYTGLVQTWHQEGNATLRIATVSALTLVRGRVVAINRSAPYEGNITVTALLGDQRTLVMRLVAAN
jgi:hypothetical protein